MKKFTKDLIERAVKTAAQTAVTALVGYSTISEVGWGHALGEVALMTLMSVLCSFGSFKFGENGTACAVKIDEKQEEKS
jgi:hypothetical protein